MNQRGRATALLSFAVERMVVSGTAECTVWTVASPWDVWWVCYRAGQSATALGVDPSRSIATCPTCRLDAVALAATSPPRHPDELGPRECGCLRAWAVQMRAPAEDIDWPHLTLSLAVAKPGSPTARVRELLEDTHHIVQTQERILSAGDVRRLYPDAYGAEYIARQDAYLMSAPVQVLVLHFKAGAVAIAKSIKTGIRARLGVRDVLRNHLHMPDSPGDALCDIAHLAGTETLIRLYERYDRDHTAERLARYRALLGAQRGGVGTHERCP